MTDDFRNKNSELVTSDGWGGTFGIQRGALYHTRAGLSSLLSEVYFLTEVSEDDVAEVPDYILSDTLQCDLDSSVSTCAYFLKETGYFPSDTEVTTQMGAVPEGEREGVHIKNWCDIDLKNFEGEPLYTSDQLASAVEAGESELGAALWLIVKDICDAGGFLSEEWYQARIVYEYFRNYPVTTESAYLIGELFKEICSKQQFEEELGAYYEALADAQKRRKKGAQKTAEKAEELRSRCIELFVALYEKNGPRLLMAPDEVKAIELRDAALEMYPADFQRAGKPYKKEWFLRNIIEDRRLELTQAVEASDDK